jgi:hypothetical protein
MKENTKQPPNGCREENRTGVNAKFNPRATMPKIDVLKAKVTTNIQTIKSKTY